MFNKYSISLKIWLIFIFLFSQCNSQLDSQTSKKKNNGFRLPTSIQPIHYTIRLKAFLQDNFTIEGSIELLFKVVENTNHIILHMKDIITYNKTAALISVNTTQVIPIISQLYDHYRQFYIINLEYELTIGVIYVFSVDFKGTLSTDLHGFYRTSYINEEENRIWVAATQFQPISARRAFPCLDEPHLKATFDVYLGRLENMTALSNMPVEYTETIADHPGWVYDKFKTTVPMSTYLLAFVICDFDHLTAKNNLLNTTLKLWSRKGTIEKAEFGKEVAMKGLLYLEGFMNLSFPLPKLDIVAVPEMSPNAMENWGLIISRESGLLHMPGKGSATQMQWVAYLICHELAHQWFGNIVTMKWWTDLWLNEGFATFIGYSVANHIFPSWKISDSFVVSTLQKVMKIDGLATAPPVRIPVEDPYRIQESFGEIAYLKGASITRMMKYFLGENTFRNGLSQYLHKLKYKSAEEDDLYFYMTKEAHKDKSIPEDITVKDIMETWTSKPGYPVVTVLERKRNFLKLSQDIFRLRPSNNVTNGSDILWYIPLSWTSQQNSSLISDTSWFRMENTMSINSETIPPIDCWILINPKQTGFYRVNYDFNTWNQLIDQLKTDHTAIHPISRAQLVDDALNLAKIGSLDYKTAMNLFSYIIRETEYVPWAATLNNLAYIDTMLRTTSHYGAFREYLLSVISPMYEKLGISDKETDEIPEKFLRTEIVMWACHLGHRNCIDTAVNLTQMWMQNPHEPSPFPSNVADTLYCTAIKVSDEYVWRFFWDRYLQTKDTGLRNSLSSGLGCSRQVWVLQRYLQAAFNPGWGIKRQDASSVYGIIAKNEIGCFLTWNHMKENWITILEYIGQSMFGLPQLVKSVTAHFNSLQFRNEMLWFKIKYSLKLGPAKWAIEQAIESTEANINWIKMNLGSIASWLKEEGCSSTLEKKQQKKEREILTSHCIKQ